MLAPEDASAAARVSGSRRQRQQASARALDSNELFVATKAARDSAGHLVTVDLAERGGLGKLARPAIGGRDRHPAARARSQAAVDTITVRVVCNDEDALLGLGRHIAVENGSHSEG